MPCYYGIPECSGELWECQTCGEEYCEEVHFHETSKGRNVECVACERARKDEADARLIAAAPDLLEACRALLAAVAAYEAYGDATLAEYVLERLKGNPATVVGMATLAIAKAEIQQPPES